MNYTKDENDLADHIATRLNDRHSLAQHLRWAHMYRKPFLLEMLDRVMAIPDSEIEVSRGAYYTTLVKRNGRAEDTRN